MLNLQSILSPRLFFSVLLLIFCLDTTYSDSRSPVATARAVGLGSTATALADDASLSFWNPSGIPILQRQELAFSYADRFGLGLGNSYASYVFPLFERHAIGLSWVREGFRDSELSDALNLFTLSYGFRIHSSFSFGISSKFVSQSINLNDINLRNSSGYGFNIGLLYIPQFPPFKKFRLGLTLQDISGTNLRDKNTQTREEIFPQIIRIGAAYQPREELTLVLDLDDQIHAGAEYQPLASFIMRGGLQRELSPIQGISKNISYALGIGLRWSNLKVDYAYELHSVLPSTHHASVSISYNPSVISVKDALIRPSPVFKSLYRTYEESDFVDVVLRNASQDPLPVTVSIDIPTLTKTPHEETLTLPPQSTERYGFALTFPQDLLQPQSAYYDNLVQPTVKVTYTQGRRTKTATRRLSSVYVLGKGKLSWSNPHRIAAFVTQESRTIEQFARGLVGSRADILNRKFPHNNIGKAALIFDAIGVYGLRYQQDQTTPYLKIFEDDSVFDTVKYPVEFLQSKIGDCDDCTVLYCSMLENLNIPTAALDVSDPEYGHIYMMFDSGISISEAGDFFLSEKEYVLWEGRIWIPVETTLFGSSFSDAWRNGADEYHIRKERGFITEILISQAQQTFKPGVIPDIDMVLPNPSAVDELFNRDLAFFDSRLDQIATASGVSLDNAEGLYDAGATYLRLGQLDRALDSFNRAIALDPENADAYNAKGVVLTKNRKYEDAVQLYRKALDLNPRDAGYRVNIALTYFLQGKKDEAERVFKDALQVDKNFASGFSFLKDQSPRTTREIIHTDPLQRMAAERAYDDGAAYLRLNAKEKALDAFDRAIKLDPKNADAYNGKGVILTQNRKYENAVQLYRKALDLKPKEIGFHVNLAIVYHLQGKKDKAVDEYKTVVLLDSNLRGKLDFITGGKSLPSTPRPITPLQRIAAGKSYDDGAAYLRLNAKEKALDAFDRAIELNPKNSDAYNGKGVILTQNRKYDDAIKFYKKAIEIDPNVAGFHLNLAITYHLQGKKTEALGAYRQSVILDPELKGQFKFLKK